LLIKKPEQTNPRDVVDALMRYVSESAESQREIATKIGISCVTLANWFADKRSHTNATWRRSRDFLDASDTSNFSRVKKLRT
jgi:hypothetical protein